MRIVPGEKNAAPTAASLNVEQIKYLYLEIEVILLLSCQQASSAMSSVKAGHENSKSLFRCWVIFGFAQMIIFTLLVSKLDHSSFECQHLPRSLNDLTLGFRRVTLPGSSRFRSVQPKKSACRSHVIQVYVRLRGGPPL